MSSPIPYAVDDKDLDDAALWAAIDSAAAASFSSSSCSTTINPKPRNKPLTPIPFPITSPQPKFGNQPRNQRYNYSHNSGGEVVQNHRPHKISRTTNAPCVHESGPPQLMVVKHMPRTPTTPSPCITHSPEMRNCAMTDYQSPNVSTMSYGKTELRHSLAGQFPTVSLFKEYQNAAMAVSYHQLISSRAYLKLFDNSIM